MTTYQYKPLDTTQPSVRLLKVVPGDSKDPLQVEIHNAHLDKNPTYVALSYTWNQGQGQKSVKCDGAKIKVERNLYNFLRRFRASPYVRRTKLWIDALCIDQTNIPERNHQVSQMSSIYTAASSVIAWLGETTDTALESLAHKIASYGSDWQAHYSLSDDGVHAAMTHLLCKPYWSRMWVIQEFILAPNLELWWGPYRTNVSNIRGWVEHVNSWNSGKTLLHYRNKARAEAVSEEQEKRLVKALVVQDENFQGLKLRELLGAFTSSECHEKVDKVYALLGIASDVTMRRDLIPVDYSKTPFEVLRDILRFQHLFRAADDDERDLGWVISLSRRMGVQRGDFARYIFLETQDRELQALAFGFLVLPTVPLKFIGKVVRHEHAKRPESQLTPDDLAALEKMDQELHDMESLSLSSRESLKFWPRNATPSLFSIGKSKSLLSFLDETLSDHDVSEPQSHHPLHETVALEQLQGDFHDTLLPFIRDLPHEECSKLVKPERFVAQTKMGQVVYGTSPTEVGDGVHLAILDPKIGGKEVLLLDSATPGYASTHAVRGIAKLAHGFVDGQDQETHNEGDFVQVHLSNCDMLDILDLTRHELLPRDALAHIMLNSWEADKKRPQRRFGLSLHENRILEEWFAMQGQQ